ncbi:helix-turn-helix domain-containing protein [Candidatus Nitrospira salsa]
MKKEKLEVIRGSDNPFGDVGLPDADTKLVKADLCGNIIDILDKKGWSQRQASLQTGIDQADICRIKNGDLKGFTIDRLVKVLNNLNHKVEVTVRPIRRRARVEAHAQL